jgi:hypothetical protein
VRVFGGAAMILAYNPHRVSTGDIDALASPEGPVIAGIREAAAENDWPTMWLNYQAGNYASRTPGEGD